MAVGSSRNVEAIERQASVQKEQGIEVSDTSQETSASVQGNKEETSPLNFRSLKNSSKYTLMLLASANFAHMTAFSLLAPFFPKEALKKGTSQTVIGLIFSVFEFVVFFTAPVYGANDVSPMYLFPALRESLTHGIMETATSLGFMVGPAIGSFLYEAGGFGLPFYVIGSFILLNGALVCGCLPESTG
ncbi:MFS-type transporter SLC18B1-like [Aplysia californica]|uniref:MFS-type transporter SLC18B1-like n=1 Tax=Aplysia californica TaxID=6500 RepID=A0ABM1VWY7_APLCA|nr:MFS-type transporter SLC18B1-like [Aplysia californica]